MGTFMQIKSLKARSHKERYFTLRYLFIAAFMLSDTWNTQAL